MLSPDAAHVCLRRNRRAPQALPGGGHRPVRGVLANRNVPDGVAPILTVIGGLPPGTPAAIRGRVRHRVAGRAAPGLRVRPAPGAPAAVQGDRLRAVEERQGRCRDLGPAAARGPAAGGVDRAAGGAPAAGAAAAPVQLVRPRTLLRNRIHAVLAGHGHDRPAGVWSGPGREWLASLELPAVSREVIEDGLALTGATQARHRPARRGDPPACPVRPAGQGAHPAARGRAVHRAGHLGRGRRHHPVPGRPQAGVLGRADPDRPRQRPGRPLRAHLQTRLGLAAVGAVRAGPDRQALPAVRRRLPGHRRPAGQENRHHRDRRKLLTRSWHLLTDAEGAVPQPAPAPAPEKQRR
jgi:hypothetical protein